MPEIHAVTSRATRSLPDDDGLSLAEVGANSRTIEVDLGLSKTLTVTYRVNALTPAHELFFRRYATAEVGEKEMDRFLGIFGQVVTTWGLRGPLRGEDGAELVAAGASVPLTVPVLRAIPTRVLMTVLGACLTDLADPKGSAGSGR